MYHTEILLFVVLFVLLLFVYSIGKRVGKKQGQKVGRAEMAIELRAKSMRDNTCPICDR